MLEDVIFTINARDNCFLELLQEDIGHEGINRELVRVFLDFKEVLKEKNIEYSKLKSALVPSRKKHEIVLIFDRQKINSCGYGQVVWDFLFPILDPKSTNSFMSGDYIDVIKNQDLLKEMLFDELEISEYEGYLSSNQFYLVYFNNVNEETFLKLKEALGNFLPFVGLLNVSYSSPFKDYLSLILCHEFVKIGKYIIKSHPDDVDNNENERSGFEKFGYITRSLQSLYYMLFLSYKIECKRNNSDVNYSICALTSNVLNVKNMLIKITDDKLKYLKEHKRGIMKTLDLIGVSKNELEHSIKNKIINNYFFNLRIIKEDGSYIFNTILEFGVNSKKYKVIASFKYNYLNNELFLVTLF